MFLTNLPLELLRRALSFCQAPDILTLRRTCHYLRKICDDEYIWRDVLLHSDLHPTADEVPTKDALARLLAAGVTSRDGETNKLVWSRLAIAAHYISTLRMRNILDDVLEPWYSVPLESVMPFPSEDVLGPVVRIVGAYSTFSVLGFPEINDWETTAALTGFTAHIFDMRPSQRIRSPTDIFRTFGMQLAFSLIIGLLGRRVLNNMNVLSKRLAELLAEDFTVVGVDGAYGRTPVLLMICIIIWIVQGDSEASARHDLPKPRRIRLTGPLEDGLVLPLPATDNELVDAGEWAAIPARPVASFSLQESWSAWFQNRRQQLEEMVGNIEWSGYGTGSGSRSAGAQCHYETLRFSTASGLPSGWPMSVPSTLDNFIALHAENNTDDLGTYNMKGFLRKTTGVVALKQSYIGTDVVRHFTGCLTPFGISGQWSLDPGGEEGYFWLYPKEWTRPAASTQGV